MAETTTTFPVGALTPFLVPDNVFVIRGDLQGGSAAQSTTGSGNYRALGGTASGLIPVTPGETLQVAVGLAGTSNTSSTALTANGDTLGRGGSGSKPGGASSHIRRGSTRLIVAGGAGATGTDGAVSSQQATAGGNGGGATGSNGIGFGNPGIGGGADPTYATSDGESSGDTGGGGGGGLVGGRAGRYGTASQAYGAGGGGSGKVPAGGLMGTAATVGNGSAAITVGVAPYAPTQTSPAAAATVPLDVTLLVSAAFNGASSKDTLSARQVRIDGSFLFSGGSDGNPIPTAQFAAGLHTVEIRDANQHGTYGPWSAAQQFTAAAAPAAPTGLTPTPGSTLTTTPATIGFTLPPGAAGYRLRRVADDGGNLGTAVYYDSGVVNGAPSSAVVDFPTDQRAEWVQVAAIGTNGLQSAWLSGRYPIARTRPAVPVATATAVTTATGYRVPGAQTDAIDVAITNPTEAGRPAVAYCDVLAGPPGALVKVNPAPVPPNTTFRWRLPVGLVDHAVLVRAVAASGAVASGFATGSPDDGYGQASYGTFAYGL